MEYESDFKAISVQTSLGRMHVRHHEGTKQSILFIHGFASNSRTWKKLVALLPNDLDIYLLDLLGYGGSDAPHAEYSIDTQTEVLSECINKLGIVDFYLFGHSYGGWVAMRYATSGHSIKGLILEDAGGVKEGIDYQKESMKDSFNERMLELAKKYNDNKEHVILSTLEARHKNPVFGEESLNSLHVPTLIIWGSNDTMLGISAAHALNKHIKHSLLEIIEGAGHDPHYTNTEQVKAALLRFIDYH